MSPDETQSAGQEPPDPKVTDSDPSGDGPGGLAGGMGVSSERTGPVPGAEGEATHGAVDPYPDLPADEDPPPEQSAGGPRSIPTTTYRRTRSTRPPPRDTRTAESHAKAIAG